MGNEGDYLCRLSMNLGHLSSVPMQTLHNGPGKLCPSLRWNDYKMDATLAEHANERAGEIASIGFWNQDAKTGGRHAPLHALPPKIKGK